MRRRTASAGADDTEAVRIVHHDARAVPPRKAHDLRQVAHVAAHGEHAVGHDEAAGAVRHLLQPGFKIRHVVVAVAEHPGVGELAAVVDAGVVLLVAQDIVILAAHGGDDAQIGLEACGERHHGFLAEELGQLPLELRMQVQRAVEKTRSGTAGAVPVERRLAGRDDARVHGEPQIVVGAEHDAALALHDDLHVLAGLQLVEIRVDAQLPRLFGVFVFAFVKDVAQRFFLPLFACVAQSAYALMSACVPNSPSPSDSSRSYRSATRSSTGSFAPFSCASARAMRRSLT